MKKIALVTGGLVAVNALANIGLATARRLAYPTGGTMAGLAFIAVPAAKFLATPVPINYKQMVEDANTDSSSAAYGCQRATFQDAVS